MVLQAVEVVLSIFLLIGVGMLLSRLGWLRDEHRELISRLVVKVALPAMIVSNLFGSFTRESLIESLPGLAAPFLSILATAALGFLIAKLSRMPRERRGVFVSMFSFSNSVFIGVPVSTALFGETAMPYTLMYYIANTFLFWTIGAEIMRLDGVRKAGEAAKPTSKLNLRAAIKRFLPIPLLTFFICVILLLVGFQPPKFIQMGAKYIGGMVTPLSLFYTSMILMRMFREKQMRWHASYVWVLIGRFVVCPALLFLCSLFIDMPNLMRDVLFVQAAMPVMAQTPIVAGEMGSDPEFAAGGLAVTTLASLAFIPLYMAIL